MRRRRTLLALLACAGCASPAVKAVRHQQPPGYAEEGLASFYGPGLYGRRTANGETLVAGSMTAAHRSLPFGTCLVVQSLASGRRVRVRINDRGPFVGGRVLDVSEAAAVELGFRSRGVDRVAFWRCEWRP